MKKITRCEAARLACFRVFRWYRRWLDGGAQDYHRVLVRKAIDSCTNAITRPYTNTAVILVCSCMVILMEIQSAALILLLLKIFSRQVAAWLIRLGIVCSGPRDHERGRYSLAVALLLLHCLQAGIIEAHLLLFTSLTENIAAVCRCSFFVASTENIR